MDTKGRMVELGKFSRYFWLIQVTGKVQSPRLTGGYWSVAAAVEPEL